MVTVVTNWLQGGYMSNNNVGIDTVWGIMGGEIVDDKDKCILDLLALLDEVDKITKCNGISIFRTSGAGGCDMYQGMTPFRKQLFVIHDKHVDVINDVFRNSRK